MKGGGGSEGAGVGGGDGGAGAAETSGGGATGPDSTEGAGCWARAVVALTRRGAEKRRA